MRSCYLITRRTWFAIHIDGNLVVVLIGQVVRHVGEVHRDGQHIVREKAKRKRRERRREERESNVLRVLELRVSEVSSR